MVGRLAAMSRPVKTVHNVHGWSFNGLADGPVNAAVIRLERWLGSRTDVILNVSGADQLRGVELGIRPRHSTELIRSGIDLTWFAGTPSPRPSTGAPTIGTVGRLATPKNPLLAVEAFAELRRLVPDARFRWVGDGPMRAEVEQAIHRAGLDESFMLCGTCRDVPGELAKLDLFVQSSRWEGLPRGLVEAVAAGVPVVATDVGGVGELIRDGVTGRLVPSGDARALAEAIHESLGDRAGAAHMAKTALDAAAEFSANVMCARTAAVYEALA